MYTSYIGKKFLKLYKEKENKPENYSAKEFFDEVLFPIFLDDEKHFLNVANSSFFQSVSAELTKTGKSIHLLKLDRFHKNVTEGPSLTTLVGYAAQDLKAGTSGQVTSLNCNIDSEEMYSSWIGSGFSIAMGGGYSILIENLEILWKLYNGWSVYRKVLGQTSNLKGNQIDVWNSHWIIHALSKSYDFSQPDDNFIIPETDVCKAEKWKKLGFIEFTSNSWSRIVFNLSQKYPNKILLVYAFKFADTNQTLGFINILLPEIKRPYELRDKLFIDKNESILEDKEIEALETFYSFSNACKMGTIGLKSIEPRGLREFMPKGTVDYSQGKEFKLEDKTFKNFQLYKLWIIAMLNKTELLKLAADVASALVDYESKDSKENRGKNDKGHETAKTKDSKNIREFIENLTELLEKTPENASVFRDVVEQTLKMPSDNFPLFATLVRFEYIYQKSN